MNGNGNSRPKEVFMIKEGKERSYWTRIGVAFVNKDGSLNVRLDSLPLDGKLHIRDPKPRSSHDDQD